MALVLAGGCQYNRLTLVNYADAEKPQTLEQAFSRSAFSKNAAGEYEILLQSSEPIAQGRDRVLKQSVYAATLWNPIPGKTYAESSQINARIIYLVEIAPEPGSVVVSEGGKTILCYKGSGFISYALDRTGQTLTGRIEQALLAPAQKKGGYRLGTFDLSGDFKAVYDHGAVGEFKMTSSNYFR